MSDKVEIKMDNNYLERDFNKLYDQMLNSEKYKEVKGDNNKLKTLFLSEADKKFAVPYEMFGSQLNYKYYFRNTLFADINLLECPDFEEREGFIEWFVSQIQLARQNLAKLV